MIFLSKDTFKCKLLQLEWQNYTDKSPGQKNSFIMTMIVPQILGDLVI